MNPADGDVPELRRWRLVLGSGPDDELSADDLAMDAALGALYDQAPQAGDDADPAATTDGPKTAGLGSSAPRLARWLGDIRTYFPTSVVQVMQRDAIDRLGITRLLLEPEMLRTVTPDVHLVSTLVTLNKLLPQRARETARQVIATVVEQVEQRLADRLRSAVRGALNRAERTRRPRHRDIDWNRTIAANLKHYQPEQRTVIPEHLVGYGRRHQGVRREIVLCVDQSGSMAASVVYASIFASVLAGISALKTSLVVYDTAVVDLTEQLSDPIEVIFGTQLGGGTDTVPALVHCESLITRPRDAVVVLISDLYDAAPEAMVRRLAAIRDGGATVVVLLALDDRGRPAYHHEAAAALANLGIVVFACTPDVFPDLIARAINRDGLQAWVESLQVASSEPAAPAV